MTNLLKYIMVFGVFVLVLPAHAKEQPREQVSNSLKVNKSSRIDPYNLPEYGWDFFQSKQKKQSSNVKPDLPSLIDSTAKKPALTIIQERYVPDEILNNPPAQNAPVSLYPDSSIISYKDSNLERPSSSPVQRKRLEIIDSAPPVLEVPEISVPDISPPAEAKIPVPATRLQSFRARKGETAQAVLQRWALRENIDLVWSATVPATLSKDISITGDFAKALDVLFADPALKPIKGQFKDIDASAFVASEPPLSVADDLKPLDLTGHQSAAQNWFASSGAGLQSVLQAWVEDAGARLIWLAKEDFAVKKSMNATSDFEQAIEELLSQYDNNAVRPTGTLYRDPQNGDKILVIESN
jgi:hypothetical protein